MLRSLFNKYHWHALLLRVVLLSPFIVLHTIGEWSYTAGIWIMDKLPDPRKET